jgi:hypothetical protein
MYMLKINSVPLALQISDKELDAGVNLTAAVNAPAANPSQVNAVAAQGRAILAAVAAKEGLVGTWRGLSQRAHAAGAPPELMTQLAEMTKQVEAADAKIREAAVPQKLHFELAPVK